MGGLSNTSHLTNSHSLSDGLSPNPLVGKHIEMLAKVEKDTQLSFLFPEGSFSLLQVVKHTSHTFSGSGVSLGFVVNEKSLGLGSRLPIEGPFF